MYTTDQYINTSSVLWTEKDLLSSYVTQTNEMHSFLNYLISLASYNFRASWVHPQGDRCVYSMVCFICIGVSSLVGRMSVKHTVLHIQLSP